MIFHESGGKISDIFMNLELKSVIFHESEGKISDMIGLMTVLIGLNTVLIGVMIVSI